MVLSCASHCKCKLDVWISHPHIKQLIGFAILNLRGQNFINVILLHFFKVGMIRSSNMFILLFEVDTSVDFVNQKLEETPQGTRSKRQIYPRYPLSYYGTRGHWYWINNYNDGKTCYAALPGDRVRFRGFSCTDLLR